jgi:predicted metalloprotease with PDZ domain
MYPVDARNGPMVVRFNQLPEGWRIATPLLSSPDGGFSAESYDRLSIRQSRSERFKNRISTRAADTIVW